MNPHRTARTALIDAQIVEVAKAATDAIIRQRGAEHQDFFSSDQVNGCKPCQAETNLGHLGKEEMPRSSIHGVRLPDAHPDFYHDKTGDGNLPEAPVQNPDEGYLNELLSSLTPSSPEFPAGVLEATIHRHSHQIHHGQSQRQHVSEADFGTDDDLKI